jgi:hypothetical protein
VSSTELVGPLPTVSFLGGPGPLFPMSTRPKVAYVPPRDTLDPRVKACTNHHVACDCREAQFAEDRSEYRAARQELQAAFDEILTGHHTWQYAEATGGVGGCMYTGCQLARALGIWPAGRMGTPPVALARP